jgi:hypothetical protein
MLEVHVGAHRPEPRLQVLSGDYLAGTFQEHDKHADRLAGELNPKSVFPQLARWDTELECSKSENSAGGTRFLSGNYARHLLEVRFYTRQ